MMAKRPKIADMNDRDFCDYVSREYGFRINLAPSGNATAPPYDGLAKLLVAHKRGDRVTTRAIFREIAVAQLGHEFVSDNDGSDVPISPNLLNLLREQYVREVSGLAALNKKSQNDAGAEHANWQQKADKIWAKHPGFSATRLAELIDPERLTTSGNISEKNSWPTAPQGQPSAFSVRTVTKFCNGRRFTWSIHFFAMPM
jgi:hypothetical protein